MSKVVAYQELVYVQLTFIRDFVNDCVVKKILNNTTRDLFKLNIWKKYHKIIVTVNSFFQNLQQTQNK